MPTIQNELECINRAIFKKTLFGKHLFILKFAVIFLKVLRQFNFLTIFIIPIDYRSDSNNSMRLQTQAIYFNLAE